MKYFFVQLLLLFLRHYVILIKYLILRVSFYQTLVGVLYNLNEPRIGRQEDVLVQFTVVFGISSGMLFQMTNL